MTGTDIGTAGEMEVTSKWELDKTLLWELDVELSISWTDGGNVSGTFEV